MTHLPDHGNKSNWRNSIYDQLHQLAKGALSRETPGRLLQPTLLVNDVYMQRLEQKNIDPANYPDVLELNDAFEARSRENSRAAQIVEMKFFGGRSGAEIAEQIGVSLRTVNNDW